MDSESIEDLADALLAPTWAELVATQNKARNFYFRGACYSVQVYCEGSLDVNEDRGETEEQVYALSGWEDVVNL